jgi:hypothetical protein
VKAIDDPNCFTFEPKEAVLRGRRWQAVVPSQLVFKVTMRPSAAGSFLRSGALRFCVRSFVMANTHAFGLSRFKVLVANGRGCELSVKGSASLEEQFDPL